MCSFYASIKFRVYQPGQFFQPVHQPGTRAADKIIIKWVNMVLLHRGQTVPTRAVGYLLGGHAVDGITEENDIGVLHQQFLDADLCPLRLQTGSGVAPAISTGEPIEMVKNRSPCVSQTTSARAFSGTVSSVAFLRSIRQRRT